MINKRPRGRPTKHAHYDALLKSLVAGEKKRPAYKNGIGVLKGSRDTTVFLKFTVRRPNLYRGKSYAEGASIEIKLGALSSWSWDALEAEKTRLQGLADRGEPLEATPTLTFSTHAEDWLELKKGQKGWGVSNGHVSGHLNPTFGTKALSDIRLGDINHWVARQRKNHKPSTVHRQLTTLKAILNYAVRSRLIDKSPATGAEPVKGIEGRRRYLSSEERDQMFKVAAAMEAESDSREKYKDHEVKGWLVDFLRWALHSGMRRGEIIDLRFGDIQKTGNGRTYALVDKTKSNRPRYVECTVEMLAIVERMRGLKRVKGDDRLFPVSLTTAKRKLTALWKVVGLEDVRLHDLRRTHITELVSGGVNLREVAGRVGHHDLSMLEEHYAVFKGDAASADLAQKLFGTRTP